MQKLNLQEKEKLYAKDYQHYIEYDYIEDNEIIITIEHCNNCEDHSVHTQHINNIYAKFAKILQKAILIRFPFLKIILKPIDTQILNTNSNYSNNNNIIDHRFKEVRIGAFEIQLAYVFKDDNNIKKLQIIEIFSKLKLKQWPSLNSVLEKIMKNVPKLNLFINVYDKEEEDKEIKEEENKEVDSKEKITSKNILFSKFENIKINLYNLKDNQIKELADLANEELERILNPKMRKIFLKQNQENINNLILSPQNNNNNNNKLSTFRPVSSLSNFNDLSKINSSRLYSARSNSSCLRPLSSVSVFKSSMLSKIVSNREKNIELLEDKESIDKHKGTLIRTNFTNLEGLCILNSLPYDSYLIEVEDSKSFLCSGFFLKFKRINESSNVTKLIPLSKQINGYLELFVYYNLDKKDFNMILLSNAEIIIQKVNNEDEAFLDAFNDNEQLLIKENKKIQGRYNSIVSPGKYLLSVECKGYEVIFKL